MSDRSKNAPDQSGADRTQLTGKLNRKALSKPESEPGSTQDYHEGTSLWLPNGDRSKDSGEEDRGTVAEAAENSQATFPTLTIPNYQILRELGRGGMGVVYQAQHVQLNRTVALKMILAGARASQEELTRFRTEAESVARLTHPGIVQIYEIGEHQGLPFFSLEFCVGGSLEDRLAGIPLSPSAAAEVVHQLAEAIQVAHEVHVIHRDLKPANVLLDADGKLKITDFGLAKKLDEEGRTQSGAIVGTPSYLAPEQAGNQSSLGPPTDVYALGAILYECLTGRPPFRSATALETVLQVLGTEPVSPRELQPEVPRDLETICLKCLQKDPRKRYASANALAEDLACFQQDRPISARPVGSVEKAWRWCRRNPAVARLLALVMVVLLAGATLSTWFGFRARFSAEQAQIHAERAEGKAEAERKSRQAAESARQEAEKARQTAEKAHQETMIARLAEKQRAEELAKQVTLTQKELARANFINYAFSIDDARQAAHQGDFVDAQALLSRTTPHLRGWEHDFVYRLTLPELLMKGHVRGVTSVAFSADGRRIVSGGREGWVLVWNALTGQRELTLKGHVGWVESVAISRDGQRIVSGSAAGWIRVGQRDPGEVKVWDARSGKEVVSFKKHTNSVISVAFSPDAQWVASGGKDKTVKVWEARTGKELLNLSGHSAGVTSVAFSPDAKWVISGSLDKTVRVWSTDTGKERFSPRIMANPVTSVAIGPAGKRMVSGSKDGTMKLWDAVSGKEVFPIRGRHAIRVNSVAFSADGRQFVSASEDRTMKVWEVATGLPVASLRGHSTNVTGAAFGPEGKRVVTGSWDQTVKVWNLGAREEFLSHKAHQQSVTGVAFGPEGKRVASGSWDKMVHVWDVDTGDSLTLKGHSGDVLSVAFSPDGKLIVSGSQSSKAKVWDAVTGKEILTFEGHLNPIHCVAFSPGGERIVSGGNDKDVLVWNAVSGKVMLTLKGHTQRVTSVAFSPDGARIVSGSDDRTVRVWNARTGKATLTLKGHRKHVHCVAFSPDGSNIASGSGGDKREAGTKTLRLWGEVKVWDANTGEVLFTLVGHSHDVTSVAYSPQGKRILTGSWDGTLKVWDAVTGELALTPAKHHADINCVAFSADGRRIVSGDENGRLQLWDTAPRASIQQFDRP